MALVYETKIKHFLADDERDYLPIVGATYDGSTVTSQDLPVGSTVLYKYTGVIKRWSGSGWVLAEEEADYTAILLAEILTELRTLNSTVEAVLNS